MNHKFYTNKKLLPAVTVLIATIAIIPALSGQGFAQSSVSDVRPVAPRIADISSADVSALVPEISVDVFETASEIKFSGATEGWSLIGGYAFESEIEIEGTAVRGDDGIWQVQAEGKLKVGDREAKLLLKGRAYDGHLRLHGTGILENGQEFRIFLVGNYAPTIVEGEYALGFRGAYVKFSENGFRIPMMQVGQVSVYPVNHEADIQ